MRRLLVAAALVSASWVAIAPNALAQCRNGWCEVGCYLDDHYCFSFKLEDRGYPVRTMKYRNSAVKKFTFGVMIDCREYRKKDISMMEREDDEAMLPTYPWEAGEWEPVKPGTVMDVLLTTACDK